MKVYEFPAGAVVLDFDAPTLYFWDDEEGGPLMDDDVYDVCVSLSRKWQLGQFWLYRTLSGLHVVFEHLLASQSDVLDCMLDANDRQGWKLCGGYMAMHANVALTLRVGVKGERPFDIRPLDAVDESAPWFVREHHDLVLSQGGIT